MMGFKKAGMKVKQEKVRVRACHAGERFVGGGQLSHVVHMLLLMRYKIDP